MRLIAGISRSRPALTVAVLAAVAALILGSGLVPLSVAGPFSDTVFPLVAIAAGVTLLLAARRAESRERRAWRLVAWGVIAQGAGDASWGWYTIVRSTETPYPGLPDVFYLSGYVLIAAGIVLLPHARSSGFERVRLLLDSLAGTVAVFLVMWRATLQPMADAYTDAPIGELVVSLGYPFGDLLMLTAVVILSTRRGIYLHDARLRWIALALVAFTAGDLIFLHAQATGEYTSGSPVDATWLAAYGMFAIAATRIGLNGRRREPTDRPPAPWQTAVPYVAVVILLAMFAVDLLRVGLLGSETTMTVGVFLVILLVIVRQWIAGRETRELVERERNHLVSVVSHELRTPLTAISGFLEVLADEDSGLTDNERREVLGIATQQTRYLGRIVSDLIDVSRSSTRTDRIHPRLLNAASAVSEVMRALPADDLVTVEVPEGLTMLADPDRFTQIMSNLLTNARRYGGPQIAISARSTPAGIEFAVDDDGPGVPRRFESQIWERFERGTHALDSAVAGSGLGLPLVRSLARAHGGDAGYERSELLGGSRFWFVLPTASPVARPIPVERTAA